MSRWLRMTGQSIGALVVSVVLVTAICFALMTIGLGDPLAALYGERLTAVSPAEAANLRKLYGLDRPLLGQYITWLFALAKGDFGISYQSGRPVLEMLGDRLEATLILTVPALVLGYAVAMALGTWMARRAGSPGDRLAHMGLFALWSMPSFLTGLILLALFGIALEIVPIGGIAPLGDAFDIRHSLPYLVLPLTVLTLHTAARLTGIVRAAMVTELASDYIRSARALGLSAHTQCRYAMRSCLFALVTTASFQLPRLFAGAVMTEMIFAWPGMGRLLLTAAYARDYPLLLGAIVVISVLTVASSLVADLVCRALDPRIRRRREEDAR